MVKPTEPILKILFKLLMLFFSLNYFSQAAEIKKTFINEKIGCLAAKCHDDLSKGLSVHKPIKAKEKSCKICHEATANQAAEPNSKLPPGHLIYNAKKTTVEAKNKNCVICHDSLESLLNPTVKSPNGKETNIHVVHKPVYEKGCLECHDAHHSKNLALLKEPLGSASCLNCHQKLKNEMGHATHGHAKIFEKKSCLNCHSPHGKTGHPALLKKSVTDTCLTCHDDNPNLKAWKSQPSMRHGAIAKNQVAAPECTNCHSVHGNSNRALLKANYTDAFHADFSLNNSELCFRCHKTELATQKNGQGITEFRHGDLNLHFIHLNQPQRARTCRACHDAHWSDQPKLIGRWVKYQSYYLPLEFQKSADGATCLTACHGSAVYKRAKE